MEKDDLSDAPMAPEPPLTRLIDHRPGQPGQPGEDESSLPQPNPPRRGGADDYASGTPEHDDDREA